ILRSLLARVMGPYARYGLIAMGLLLALAGWQLEILLLLVFGLLATLANIRPRKIDSGLTPMTRLEIAISAFAFVAVLGAYA
ncbi:hypothetical protein, partial [Salmonella sp. SAL4357]|uniref:hypothetical protein n=1 Tax=Salmonella sp. SAL4357 TaxID=3159878 RepID=UPI00397C1255